MARGTTRSTLLLTEVRRTGQCRRTGVVRSSTRIVWWPEIAARPITDEYLSIPGHGRACAMQWRASAMPSRTSSSRAWPAGLSAPGLRPSGGRSGAECGVGMGYRGYRGYRVRKVGEVVVVHLRREKLLACSHQQTNKHERRGSPLQEGIDPLLPIGTVGRAAAPQSSHNAVKGIDDPDNGTDNASNGTDNAV
jgi:hypothetical protein